jgi:tetratricopeptide (TPR) repeat protein/mono/diheme cytochrome c family protein
MPTPRNAKLRLLILLAACAPFVWRAAAQAPTFNRDLAPLVFAHCAACHHAGGAAPFALMTYAEVKQRARQIAETVESRYMPPWLPEPGPLALADEQRLSEEQIKLVRRWVDAGMLEGDVKDLPRAPQFSAGWRLGQPDLIVKMDEAFVVPAEGLDVFRNFVLPLPVTATKFVKAVEILPGNPRVVHHANLLIDRAQSARALDARDPGPGFGGMEVTIATDSFDPDSHFLFWKPGSAPAVEPDELAWRCEPGTDLILNLHLQPSGKPERLQVAVGLYFTARAPTLFPMLLQLEHDGALDIPPGAREFVITDQFKLPVDVEVLGVYPHAHYLGKNLEGFAVLPDGAKQELIRITRWDLNWQGVYKFRRPLALPKGTTLALRFSYDNSAANPRNPHNPPQRVRAGNRSSEEMGHLWIQVLPRTPQVNGQDARLLLQEALMRRRLEKYPADFTAHFNLGAALQSAGREAEAIPHFQTALRARPNDAATHTNLAVALQITGKLAAALNHYRQALRARPAYANARYNLANLLLQQGQMAEAVLHLRELLRAQPDDAGAHNSLGSALAMQNNFAEAARHFAEAVRLAPEHADAHANLAAVFVQQNKLNEALSHYETAVRLKPDNAEAQHELGVLLARRGELARAIGHFEQALRLNPNLPGARENLQRARAALKR